MSTVSNPTITIETTIHAPIQTVWDNWVSTDAITKWNSASPDWHTPKADHDLRPGGKFNYRMEAKDGSFGFDFSGVFDRVEPESYLESTIADGRKVKTSFQLIGDATLVSQTFEAEQQNPLEMQQQGWQAILNNFKNYVEQNKEQ